MPRQIAARIDALKEVWKEAPERAVELAVEPPLQIDLRRHQQKRTGDERNEHAPYALAEIIGVAPCAQRVPGAHPCQEHEQRHDPWRHNEGDLAGNSTPPH